MPSPPDPTADAARADRAVALAERLLRESQREITRDERRRQRRLGRIVADPAGRELVQQLTDEVLRLRRDPVAAARFRAIVADHGVPRSLGAIDRILLALGARLGTMLPRLVMPLVRRRIVAETRGMVNRAEDPALAEHIARRAAAGVDLNLNLLGEAILSDDEANVRVQRLVELVRRGDVSYISVKISAICAQLDVDAFEHSVDRIAVALREVFAAAIAVKPPVFVNLDMEEYADLHLTVAAFTSVLDEEPYRTFAAGIVVQAYLPDSHDALAHLGAWAVARVAAGGAPIKVRIVKGANLAMEQVDAEQHGWVQAPYPSKAETDASYKRLLDSALRPAWAGAVHVGVASHNLFEVAWALVMRDELSDEQRGRLEIEMLEGMVPAQARAVQAAAGELLLYCPIVREDEFEASLAYLARRFDENTAPDNFLRAMFSMRAGSVEFREQEARFRQAVAQRHTVSTTPQRPAHAPRRADTTRPSMVSGASVELDAFTNEPDTDLTDAATRAAIWAAIGAVPDPASAGMPVLDRIDQIDAVIATAVGAVDGWSGRGAAGRVAVLCDVADLMTAERPTSIAVMAAEAGKTVREADPEVSEAIDFARYAATTALPPASPPYGVVVVAAPWNFPYAIPAGGVFAALMAGNAVVLKPAPEVRATAWHLANQCWRAGVPRDVLQFVACPDDEVGQRLITHPDVATVVLTGAYATAQLFLDWKPAMRLLAETSGKNAIVVCESADLDAAIRDIVRSAFGHAGQKCSAASLAILAAPLYDDPSFLERLAAAVRTLDVGEASDPATTMGPLILPPGPTLLRGLTSLDHGERWLVQPRRLDADGRMWSPGVRIGVQPGSWFHVTECFGPVLGVMRAEDLDHAVELQNATPFGLTGGIHALDGREVARWLRNVEVGNAYVNRHITGAIVRRQPFGGWKRSSVGGGPKSGGPNYVATFVRTPCLAVDPVVAMQSYAAAWKAEFGAEHDPSALRSEANVLRYRPLRHVLVRIGDDTPPGALAAARAAASCCGVRLTVSDANESVAALVARLPSLRVDRLRLLTATADEFDDVRRACHAADIAVDATPISADGRFELIHWVREQSLSITKHRYGRITP